MFSARSVPRCYKRAGWELQSVCEVKSSWLVSESLSGLLRVSPCQLLLLGVG
jgi:hypothetical protein